ncbi:MAG: carbon-nitrogen hydrolase family protein [Candidatus Nezhaarchaeales archaeon]
MKLRVAAVQVEPKHSISEGLQEALTLTRNAVNDGATLICLPESWLFPEPRRNLALLKEGYEAAVKAFTELASEYNVYVVPGALHTVFKGSLRIRSPIIGPKGLMGYQDKMHPFKDERGIVEPAEAVEVFELKGFKLGIAVCYDLVFPEVVRIMALKDVDVVLNPSRITSNAWESWQLYLKARALENRVYTVGVNIVKPPTWLGHSCITGFQVQADSVFHVKLIAEAGETPSAIVADLDLELTRKSRRERMKDRRPNLYKPLT